MAIIFDMGLLARRKSQTLTPTDLCKLALCSALTAQLPDVTVYTSAQAQGVTAPAVFVRFGRIAARGKLDDIEQVTVEAQCRYLPLVSQDDGENETAMQAMLDALRAISGKEADFCCRNRVGERTERGAIGTGEICLEIRRKDAAALAEDIMRTLEQGTQVDTAGTKLINLYHQNEKEISKWHN
ncbi:MAG: DUF6838 family protein [Candidatus Fimivivens sp.]